MNNGKETAPVAIRKVKLGDRVVRTPVTIQEYAPMNSRRFLLKSMTGTVIYIHPKGRYHTVEFQIRCGPVRENFHGTAY